MKSIRRFALTTLAAVTLLVAASPVSALCFCNRRCPAQGAACETAFVQTCYTVFGSGCLLVSCDCYSESFC